MVANDIYRIYLAEVMALAKTMVIKSETNAVAINKYLTDYRLANVSSDKRTWRYYMNISGAYHSTNRMMRVLSMDTYEEIDFTVENMKIHRATWREYSKGGRYFKQLNELYPGQTLLIMGILNPVNMDEALAAEEGTILWYDKNLVESNEQNLIESIQKEIYLFNERYHVEDYSRIEDLYDPARWNILMAQLPMWIINARLKNCRTIFAHSFHIRAFLASHGRLDRFMDSMTKKQQLFFYRNLPYLNRNPGQVNIFDWLVDNVLVERNFPLAKYRMVHNNSEMPNELYPQIELIRKETTPGYDQLPETRYSVEEVLEKEITLASGNAKYIDEEAASVEEEMVYGKNSQVLTKVLESSVIDRSDSQVFTLAGTLFNHWLFLSATGRYRALARIVNPRTGEEMAIAALDAFVLFIYAYNKSMELTLEFVPHLVANRVRRIPQPSIESLKGPTSVKYLSPELAEQLYDMASPVDSYISTASFNEAITAVYKTSLDQFRLASSQGNHHVRGHAMAFVEGMYQNVGLEVGAGQSYSIWLKERGLEQVEDFGQFELEELASSLLEVSTGSDLNVRVSLNDIHRDMVGIMSRMSSYSVQFVREINTTPLRPVDIRFIRPGNFAAEEEGYNQIDLHKNKMIRAKGAEEGYRKIPNVFVLDARNEGGYEQHLNRIKLGLDVTRAAYTEHLARIESSILRPKPVGIIPLVELSSIMIKDYSDIVVIPGEVPDIPIDTVLSNVDLDGLNPPPIIEVPLDTLLRTVDLDGLNYTHPLLADLIAVDELNGFRPVTDGALGVEIKKDKLDGFHRVTVDALGRVIENDQLDGFNPNE